MKFFIDTANMEEIKEAFHLGIISGVTTNPSLVAKEKDISFHDRLREITELVPGSVSGEVIALDAEGMIKEGRELAAIAPNITVKIPMTPDGMKAVSDTFKRRYQNQCNSYFQCEPSIACCKSRCNLCVTIS